jgi:dihydroorotase
VRRAEARGRGDPDVGVKAAAASATIGAGTGAIRNARHWKSGERIDLDWANGRITRVSTGAEAPLPAASGAIDAGGATLAPGLVDLHVHLREPGQSGKETIETGTAAAAAGGFTAVACMPNTNPVIDRVEWVEWLLARAEKVARCRVLPIAAVTVGQAGEQLTEMHALAAAGAVAFSDDGRPVASAAVMRHALEYARELGRPIVGHEEEPALARGGHMAEGPVATRLGIRGIPGAAESIMVRRDVELAALTRGRVHLAHLSAAESFEGLRDAKRRDLPVTGEVCPHHWTLTDEAVGDYDTMAKMNPPLRSARDRDAAIRAIADGTVDCLATDHAPHTAAEKQQPFAAAPFGIVGLETALALTLTHLVEPGHIALARSIELWTEAPRRVFALPEVRLEPGFPADLVVFGAAEEWTVDPEAFRSKGRNTPFAGHRLRGRVHLTICGGAVTHAALPAPVDAPSLR